MHIKLLSLFATISLLIKIVMQTGTIIPWVGIVVFGNRPIIIGYLHLVMLGFITLYLLAYFLKYGWLDVNSTFTKTAIWVFTSGVIINELFLMLQGISQICMIFYTIYLWLLWMAVIWLLIGAILLFIARVKFLRS